MSKIFKFEIIWGGEIQRVRGSCKTSRFLTVGIWRKGGDLKVHVNHNL